MLILLMVALLLGGAPQEKTKYVLEVPQGDTVVFEFPKDWKLEKSLARPGMPPTLKLTPPNPSAMSLQITMKSLDTPATTGAASPSPARPPSSC